MTMFVVEKRSGKEPGPGPTEVGSATGLPALQRGRHRNSAGGLCLMEYVSVLAGSRFSDHPPCTHWMLAALARSVNDLVGDDARRSLALRAPDIARFGPSTRGVAIAVTSAVSFAHRQARATLGVEDPEAEALRPIRRASVRLKAATRRLTRRDHLDRATTTAERDEQYRSVLDSVASVYEIVAQSAHDRDRYLVKMLDNVIDDLDRNARSGW